MRCYIRFVTALLAASVAAAEAASSSTKAPGVPPGMRGKMCTDLCMSGLGGSPCGEFCDPNMAAALHKMARSGVARTAVSVHGPRRAMCPVLCAYGLGEPLCGCDAYTVERRFLKSAVDWPDVCTQFCTKEGLTVYGCKRCVPQSKLIKSAAHARYAAVEGNAVDGGADVDWAELCHSLCASGEGGLACNCDINP